MKIHTDTLKLKESIELASLAIGSRKSLPVLTTILVEASKDGSISVTADSLDARMSVAFDGAEIDDDFSFLVSPRLLKASLRSDHASISLKDLRLSIESGGSTKLSTIPVSEFPKPWAEVPCNPVDAPRVFSAIKVVSPCADPDPASMRHCLRWEKSTSLLIAQNGKALSAAPVDLGFDGDPSLPLSQTKLLLQGFDVDDSFEIGTDGSVLFAQQCGRKAWIRLYEGKSFSTEKIFLNGPPQAYLGREAFQNALESLSVFLEQQYTRVMLTPHDGVWMASSTGSDSESSIVVPELEELEPLKEPIVFSQAGALNAIRNWESDRISFRTDGNRIMLQTEGETGPKAVIPLIRPS